MSAKATRERARQRALEVVGNRRMALAGEVRDALLPDWRRTYGNDMLGMRRAGYALGKLLGVKMHREWTDVGWRSFIYRADLEPSATADTEPARPVPAPPSTMGEGIPRCEKCGAGKPNDDEPCWRCGTAA
jgi:hypothetical protein